MISLIGNLTAQTTNVGMFVVNTNTTFSTLEDLNNTTTGQFYNDGDSYIYANFNNDGTVDFFNRGLTRFVSFNTVQNITGNSVSYLYNVLFSNSVSESPFNLYGTISIANESNYNLGIVNNDDYGGKFIFEQDGYHINTSNSSHVDGTVLKEGNTDFVFPIGDKGYFRHASISAPQLLTDSYDGKYFLENSNNLYPHINKQSHIGIIDNKEYWVINRTLGNSDVLVTLSWSEETTPEEIIALPQEDMIHIVRWDEVTNNWVDEGGVVDTANKTVTTAISGYGIYTLARVTKIAPPCELTIFNAVSANEDGENDYFSIKNLSSGCVDKNIKVKIFNRWGVKVYESGNYGVGNNFFRGYSEGRLTVGKEDNKLPTGTYYYILELNYIDENNNVRPYKKSGYLYLTSDKN
ncbi:gliding motility-associated C-terminal domain-containing protein [Tenacibaculum sp. FZY0031]|uniref:gliding motility-associated C-terminal domain-containing protein n=1 Tax=Tenacibaculum sp. FZY0031 TaxID=3116648 RepID=UPI002EAAC0A6|nr:gliding motility-associated C-terminal domain-containing protein [Tenacibaculum sp. FZY0031]